MSGQEIEHFYGLLTHREEIDVIYGEYAKSAGFMSPENLVEFLMKEQREKVTLADANRIIDKYEPDEKGQSHVWRTCWNLHCVTSVMFMAPKCFAAKTKISVGKVSLYHV